MQRPVQPSDVERSGLKIHVCGSQSAQLRRTQTVTISQEDHCPITWRSLPSDFQDGQKLIRCEVDHLAAGQNRTLCFSRFGLWSHRLLKFDHLCGHDPPSFCRRRICLLRFPASSLAVYLLFLLPQALNVALGPQADSVTIHDNGFGRFDPTAGYPPMQRHAADANHPCSFTRAYRCHVTYVTYLLRDSQHVFGEPTQKRFRDQHHNSRRLPLEPPAGGRRSEGAGDHKPDTVEIWYEG